MLRQVGYAEPLVPSLARILFSIRAAYPRDYWWHMWHGLSEIPAEIANPAGAVAVHRARIEQGGKVLREAGVPVIVVQVRRDKTVHHRYHKFWSL